MVWVLVTQTAALPPSKRPSTYSYSGARQNGSKNPIHEVWAPDADVEPEPSV